MSSLQQPVNSYDPSGATFENQVHAMIRSDLASLGDVVSITGAIVPTHSHGIKLSGLSATVHHPRIRTDIILGVEWDEEGTSLRYRDLQSGSNLVFSPSPVSDYSSGGREEMEAELITKVFARLDAHPALKSFDMPSKGVHAISAGSLLVGGPTVISMVDLEMFSMSNEMFFAACGAAVAAGIGVGIGGVFRANRARKDLRKHNEQVGTWNSRPHQTLLDVFSTEQEKVVFMDIFYTRLAKLSMSDVGPLEVTSVPAVSEEAGASELNGNMEQFPFSSFLLAFRVRKTWFSRNTVIYWDGVTFFARFNQMENGRRISRFMPLSESASWQENAGPAESNTPQSEDKERDLGVRRLARLLSSAARESKVEREQEMLNEKLNAYEKYQSQIEDQDYEMQKAWDEMKRKQFDLEQKRRSLR